MPGLDFNRGAKRAREARAAIGLDPVGPLECLLSVVEEHFGVVVASLPETVAGACFDGSVLWVNGTQFPPRQRFTLAHELGHAWIGHGGMLEPDTVDTISGRTSTPHEVQANAFAAEFLVPKAGLTERVERLDDVVRLAGDYGVSAPMMLLRVKQLGLASAVQVARMEREVDEGLHAYLAQTTVEDRLATIERLPYLSPALRGTLLDAAVHGDAAVPGEIAGALARLMRPVLR